MQQRTLSLVGPGRAGTAIATALVARGWRVVALDERGKDCGTTEFARLLGAETAFVIGGADGLDPALKERAQTLIRLSSLTLPHGMVRVLLAEDNDLDAALFAKLNERCGSVFNLVRVVDGEAAVDYLRGAGPFADREKHPQANLLLLDLKMPKKDGSRSCAGGRSTPLFCTCR
mgnify:CR=1 FL=1